MRGEVNGMDVRLGSAAWLRDSGVALDTFTDEADRRVVFAVIGRRPALRFELTDTVRPEAKGVVEALANAGLTQTLLLSGDHLLAAAGVARSVGILDFRAGCLPEQKLDEVRALKREGRRVLVVGDGVNDALALAAGDLSVAINHSGSHIAVQTADIALLQDNLHRLTEFIQVAHRSMQLINQNLIVSTAIIAVALLLSALGLVNPLTAALLHEASAFFVLINSSRLLRFPT
jgi:P-type E1-E2 ATPase